jgi:hypothetical protein
MEDEDKDFRIRDVKYWMGGYWIEGYWNGGYWRKGY